MSLQTAERPRGVPWFRYGIAAAAVVVVFPPSLPCFSCVLMKICVNENITLAFPWLSSSAGRMRIGVELQCDDQLSAQDKICSGTQEEAVTHSHCQQERLKLLISGQIKKQATVKIYKAHTEAEGKMIQGEIIKKKGHSVT